jgi:hypothetical protein
VSPETFRTVLRRVFWTLSSLQKTIIYKTATAVSGAPYNFQLARLNTFARTEAIQQGWPILDAFPLSFTRLDRYFTAIHTFPVSSPSARPHTAFPRTVSNEIFLVLVNMLCNESPHQTEDS